MLIFATELNPYLHSSNTKTKRNPGGGGGGGGLENKKKIKIIN
jgi:hypothetical protein